MVRARPAFAWLLVCAPLLALAACQPSENAVLITATTEGDIDTMRVVVIDLEGERQTDRTTHNINRTADDINDVDPLRIAVELPEPGSVLIHIEAQGRGGAKFVATRCIPVEGVIEESVHLVSPDTTVDPDQDGFPVDPRDTCFESSGTPCVRFVCEAAIGGDCNEGTVCDPTMEPTCTDPPQATYPGAPEICQDGLDQDCSHVGQPPEVGDVACGDMDGDGFEVCSPSGGRCDCDDSDPRINPDAEESIVYDPTNPENNTCGDGIDQNCDGVYLQCDRDGDGFPADMESMGYPDCNDADPAINPGTEEVCTETGGTPTDENCNGRIDELAGCAPDDMDNDGVVACGTPGAPALCDCNDCDAGIKPGIEERCNDGVDQDCDGSDATCPANDADGDGYVSQAMGGVDCDDGAFTVSPGAPEVCANSVDDNCNTTVDESCPDMDMDGYVETGDLAMCEGNPARNPGALEACDLEDNDCDTVTDEVLSPPTMVGAVNFPNGERGCVPANPTTETCMSGACAIDFRSSFFHCSGCRVACDIIRADLCRDGVCICERGGRPSDACPDGTRCCPGGCPSLQDPANCGGCGVNCNEGRPGNRPAADICTADTCGCGGGPACGDGQMCCGGTCVPFDNDDVNNCGGCGIRCSVANGTAVCDAGTCRIGGCDSLWDDCDGNYGNGCETSLQGLGNCGSCDTSCSRANATATCGGGTCRIQGCSGNFGNCDGGDANGCELRLNMLDNCGMCGTTCSRSNATATCSTGSCRIDMCNSLQGNCDGNDSNGCETALTSTTNCGACGTPCTRARATATCSTGTCAIQTCNTGYGNCDGNDANGCETPLNTDTNCGACGAGCSSPDTCGGGGTARVCGCTPTTCMALGFNCGTAPNGCGGMLSCGSCSGFNTCGGGGTANVCGCTPTTCAAEGANCGSIPNECGGMLSCGSCTSPNTCGGGGTPNVCGCTPTT